MSPELQIRDDAMHADLKAMLEVHEANIARAEKTLKSA